MNNYKICLLLLAIATSSIYSRSVFEKFGLKYRYSNEGSSNPFDLASHEYAVNPHYVQEIQNSQTLTDSQKAILSNIAAAFWIDSIDAISTRANSLKGYLASALAKQQQSGKKQTVVFIVYNLPNRDCAAAASNGEICCDGVVPNPTTGSCNDQAYNSGDCSNGVNKYKQYIDSIVATIQDYKDLELVALIEPDSLPNLVTNLGQKPHCTTTTEQGYLQGIVYAIESLVQQNVKLYIDIAHGGWLGWCGTHPCSQDNECNGQKCLNKVCQCDPTQDSQNAQKFIKFIQQIFQTVEQSVGSALLANVRGFATNTANYQPLGYPVDEDPCQLNTQYNFAGNELRYINQMDSLFKANGINKSFITDTGRNGLDVRKDPTSCQQWCNIIGGMGIRPTSDVSMLSTLTNATIDALFWLKTPGESDGCSPGSGQTCQRVDQMCQRDCNSGFQKCPAPEAGAWDDVMIRKLADNAVPALSGSKSEY